MNDINYQNNNEIDLIELIKALWNKKIWILLSAFLGTAIAAGYAFTAKEQWTSKAEIIAPRILDLGTYFNLRKEYGRILNQPFDSGALQGRLFNEFNIFSESLDVRKNFFENSEYYKRLVSKKSLNEKRVILNSLVTKNILVVKPDPKKEPDLLGRKILFSAENPDDAQEVLTQFIDYVNDSSVKLELDNFLLDVNEVIHDLQFEKLKFETNLQIQKNVQLGNLENSLRIATEAGIKDYIKPLGSSNSTAQVIAMSETKIPLSDSKLSDGTYLFMLGEKYLKAQIDVLKQSNVIYPPRYYEVSTLLSQLKTLLFKVNDVKIQSFSYQASPNYPQNNMNKLLILVIGAIIGLVLYIIFNVIQFYLFKYKN